MFRQLHAYRIERKLEALEGRAINTCGMIDTRKAIRNALNEFCRLKERIDGKNLETQMVSENVQAIKTTIITESTREIEQKRNEKTPKIDFWNRLGWIGIGTAFSTIGITLVNISIHLGKNKSIFEAGLGTLVGPALVSLVAGFLGGITSIFLSVGSEKREILHLEKFRDQCIKVASEIESLIVQKLRKD